MKAWSHASCFAYRMISIGTIKAALRKKKRMSRDAERFFKGFPRRDRGNQIDTWYEDAGISQE